jgi:hypothetical protein
MKVKPGMSDYQRRPWLNSCRCEKAKLRTVEKRTVTRRVKEIDEIKELAIMHPLRIKQRKRERNAALDKIHHCSAYGKRF